MEANLENIKKALFEGNFIFKKYYTYPTSGLDKLWFANEHVTFAQYQCSDADIELMLRIFQIRSLLLKNENIQTINDNKTAVEIEVENLKQPVYLSYKDGFTSICLNIKQHDVVNDQSIGFDVSSVKNNFKSKIVSNVYVATFLHDIDKYGEIRKLSSIVNVLVHVKEMLDDKIISALICDGVSNWTNVNYPCFENISPEIEIKSFTIESYKNNRGYILPRFKVKEMLKNFEYYQSSKLTQANSTTGIFE